MIRLLSFVFVGVAALAALLNGLAFARISITTATESVPRVEPVPWSPVRTAGAALQLDHPPLTQFTLTSTRPVFFEGRRYPAKPMIAAAPPPPAPVQIAPPPPPPKPVFPVEKLALRGIMTTQAGERAMIEILQGETKWYALGDLVTDWKITRVAPDAVEIEAAGGQTATLKLYNSTVSK